MDTKRAQEIVAETLRKVGRGVGLSNTSPYSVLGGPQSVRQAGAYNQPNLVPKPPIRANNRGLLVASDNQRHQQIMSELGRGAAAVYWDAPPPSAEELAAQHARGERQAIENNPIIRSVLSGRTVEEETRDPSSPEEIALTGLIKEVTQFLEGVDCRPEQLLSDIKVSKEQAHVIRHQAMQLLRRLAEVDGEEPIDWQQDFYAPSL